MGAMASAYALAQHLRLGRANLLHRDLHIVVLTEDEHESAEFGLMRRKMKPERPPTHSGDKLACFARDP